MKTSEHSDQEIMNYPFGLYTDKGNDDQTVLKYWIIMANMY